jgi:ceramide synthetase
LELGMYLHLVVYQFVDTKRSDFWEMFVHHIATIGLIVFSWMSW